MSSGWLFAASPPGLTASRHPEDALDHPADGSHLVAALCGVVGGELAVDVDHSPSVLVVGGEASGVDGCALARLEDDDAVGGGVSCEDTVASPHGRERLAVVDRTAPRQDEQRTLAVLARGRHE